MAELADAPVLGAGSQKECRFKSCSRHHRPSVPTKTPVCNISVIRAILS